ncbi:MAG: NGG1p interacting factor NIF3 [Candidatus Omnitrophota bacterium]
MKLKTFYELAVNKGMQEDQRPKKAIEKELANERKSYNSKKGIEKESFDKESFKHPYHDTRILTGSGREEVKHILVGIDIDAGEILLADRLKEKGIDIDLIVSHHPSGRAYAQLHKVMGIQPVLWEKYGLNEEVAEGMMKSRKEEVARGVSSANHERAVDTARLLGIPFVCIHTAADNCVANFLQKIFNKGKPKKLRDILKILRDIPEYHEGMKKGSGPFLLIGEEKSDAGKIFVDMTGGTSGPDKMFSRLSQAGVKTIVGMHCKESGFNIAKAEFINYVIAGHISSDTLGLNLLFDSIEKKEKLNFIECSGFRRIRRI